MTHNIYIYMFIMAAVTYTIRVLPLTLIRKEITNTFIRGKRSFQRRLHGPCQIQDGDYIF